MKKVICVCLIMVLIAGNVFAGLQANDVQEKVINKLKSLRSSAASLSGNISSTKSAIQDLVASYADDFVAGDKTSLQAINTDAQSAATALDVLVAEIDTQFASIND